MYKFATKNGILFAGFENSDHPATGCAYMSAKADKDAEIYKKNKQATHCNWWYKIKDNFAGGRDDYYQREFWKKYYPSYGERYESVNERIGMF